MKGLSLSLRITAAILMALACLSLRVLKLPYQIETTNPILYLLLKQRNHDGV